MNPRGRPRWWEYAVGKGGGLVGAPYVERTIHSLQPAAYVQTDAEILRELETNALEALYYVVASVTRKLFRVSWLVGVMARHELQRPLQDTQSNRILFSPLTYIHLGSAVHRH